MSDYTEDTLIEQATQETLEALGWEIATAWHAESFGEGGLLGRENKGEVVLVRYLRASLEKLNPGLPETAYTKAVELVCQKIADQDLGRINKEKYALLKGGVPVSYTNDIGELVKKKLAVFDFDTPTNNHFLSVRQLEVVGELYQRRPDVVGFVNGIPLVFIELKAHGVDLQSAYEDNLRDYKDTIPHMLHHNGFIILSNGVDSKVGTVTSPYKYFLDWKRIEEDEEGTVSLDTMLRGTCDKTRLMDIFENFLLFDDAGGEVNKLMAKNHQYIGVNKVLENVRNIDELQGKLGVFWHTQGSGKSYSMVFLCEKVHRKIGGSYTFLIAVDRTELENQLYDTFSGVGAVHDKSVRAGTKSGMTGREHLRELLGQNHRYVFTLIHKFSIDPKLETEFPLITDRKNVIVISDEAHRTQGGTYARNMRYFGLPNASYLGFTGTPLIKDEDEFTKDIFGDYISVYDFKRAIEDDATLPLRYLNKGEKLQIENPELDEQMAAVLDDEDLDEDKRQKLEYLFSRNYPILTAEARLDAIAKDLVWHFNERGYQGKAMFVALDKPTAVRMHKLVMKYWPEYLAELGKKIDKEDDVQAKMDLLRKRDRVAETEVCVVVSSEQNEVDKFRKMDLDIETHRRKMVDRNLEKEFKDAENPFRLAIVCAMWITGFDAQCVSTVYLDKPIKGHTLMQTIARANRVYDDEKENGLIVDYGNVYKQLEKAYSVYGEGGGGGDRKDELPIEMLEGLEAELIGAITAVVEYLKSQNFDLDDLKDTSAMERLTHLSRAENCVCLNETTRTTFEVMARNVLKKYKALFPEKQAKKHTGDYEAIQAIYRLLNKKVKNADITSIMKRLQDVVDGSVSPLNEVHEGEVYIDLSNLDFDKLKQAFAKSPNKNTITYTLQEAVERQLEQMLKENPLRVDFYDRYQKIIEEYNKGKSMEDTVKAFEDLTTFVDNLTEEEQRAKREGIENQEILAIYDLLCEGKELNSEELKTVKKVAKKTLDTLKDDKLQVAQWRQSRQVAAQVKTCIYGQLLYLPQESYTDKDVGVKSANVYQHIYTNYYGDGKSVYQESA